jgi:preprotein translocase subunit SecF
MYHITENRKWYFLLSALVILPGLVAMIYSLATIGTPFRLAIDFTGGSLWELQFDQPIQPGDVREVFVAAGHGDAIVTTVGSTRTADVRTKLLDEAERLQLMESLRGRFGNVTEVQFASVGPTIGREVTRSAALAVVATSFVILAFLVIAFRSSSNPIRFGISAIVAMLHDLLVTAGVFSILSLILGWEADALFLTAILTVIGFSVQDTIVVFDRVRENAPKYRGERFSRIVNRSILETMNRSIATQVTGLLVLVAILVFGGQTIKPFIATLAIGVLTGTYSSIFNAAQVLVGWEEGDLLGLRTRTPANANANANATTVAS